jgi:hypothetical protein
MRTTDLGGTPSEIDATRVIWSFVSAHVADATR